MRPMTNTNPLRRKIQSVMMASQFIVYLA